MAQYSDEMVRMLHDVNKRIMSLENQIPSFHIRDTLCTIAVCRMKAAYLQGRVDAFTEAIGVEGE